MEGFTDPDTPTGQTPFVWLFSSREQRWRKRSPANVAAMKDFYSVTDVEGEKHDLLERALSLIESAAAPVIQKKIPRCGPLTESDRLNFAGFMASMMARTPAALHMIARIGAGIVAARLKANVKTWVEDPPKWKAFLEEFNAAHPPEKRISPEQDPASFDPDNFKIGFTREADFAPMVLGASFRIIEPLLAMGWTFYRSFEPDYFVTSDHPCAAMEPENPTPFPTGVAREDTEVSLAIDRTHGFVGSWKSDGIAWRPATQAVVRAVNARTLSFSKRFVFAPKTRFPGSERWFRERE